MTESLRLAGEHKYFTTSWSDMIKTADVDTRTADEIAEDVILRAGLTVKGGSDNGCIQSCGEVDT